MIASQFALMMARKWSRLGAIGNLMNHPPYEIEVRQGIIHVNSVAPLYVSETAMLFEADTKQKYPELLGVGTGKAIIHASERTLKVVDPKAEASVIKIRLIDDPPGRMWHTGVETGRYSVFIYMFLIPNELEQAPYWINGKNIDPRKKTS